MNPSKIKKLNLGSGPYVKKGFDNQDYKKFPGVNLVFDLEKAHYPIKTNTYDYISCDHVVEHIGNIFGFFNEIHRIAKPGAIVKIECPHWSTNFAFTQIDHKHYFGLDSLNILEPTDEQNKSKPFKVLSQRILFRGSRSSKFMQLVSYPIDKIVNSSHSMQLVIDRFFSKIIPFYFIEYHLKVLKK